MSEMMPEGYDTAPTWTQRQVDAYLTAARQAGRDEERARCVATLREQAAHVGPNSTAYALAARLIETDDWHGVASTTPPTPEAKS